MTDTVPSHVDLLMPTLDVLRRTGTPTPIQAITEGVVTDQRLSMEQRTAPHGSSSRTELEYRLAWSRTYLKLLGAVDNPAPGKWTLTERGKSLRAADLPVLLRKLRTDLRKERRVKRQSEATALQPYPPAPKAAPGNDLAARLEALEEWIEWCKEELGATAARLDSLERSARKGQSAS